PRQTAWERSKHGSNLSENLRPQRVSSQWQSTGGLLIATAMLACYVDLEVGEVAITVRSDHKNLGIGWELLGHLTKYAELKGVRRLQSLENRANGAAIQSEKELGFTSEIYQGDSTLVLLQKILVQ
ncbi:GNAT superfamily N-acetyltransferase, partial [Devosia sp. UYZn731]|uniref:GNAT family N-acetyltransferase n=1 Tax=Devosia sp. UYZn731 TaxID=3156345 RepID=UPI0033976991